MVEIHFRKKKKTAQHGTYLVLFLEWSAIKRYVLLLFLFRFPLKAQRYKKYIFSPDLLAKRLFSLSFCVSFPPLLPCSRFCSPSLCRRCRPSSQREERYLGFLRSSLSRSSCRRGGGQRKEDFVRGPTGEERERESDFLGGGGRERLPPPSSPPFSAPSVRLLAPTQKGRERKEEEEEEENRKRTAGKEQKYKTLLSSGQQNAIASVAKAHDFKGASSGDSGSGHAVSLPPGSSGTPPVPEADGRRAGSGPEAEPDSGVFPRHSVRRRSPHPPPSSS